MLQGDLNRFRRRVHVCCVQTSGICVMSATACCAINRIISVSFRRTHSAVIHRSIRSSLSLCAFILMPRDAMHKRGLYAVRRCPSVCLSATFVYSVETNKHYVIIFKFKKKKHYVKSSNSDVDRKGLCHVNIAVADSCSSDISIIFKFFQRRIATPS